MKYVLSSWAADNGVCSGSNCHPLFTHVYSKCNHLLTFLVTPLCGTELAEVQVKSEVVICCFTTRRIVR